MRPLGLSIGFLLALVHPSAAQVPDTFTNLKVLPEDIPRSELIAQMREFSFALGERCSYCHAVSDALNDPNDDFASDEKVTKRRARAMLEMVRAINEQHLPRLPERDQPGVAVECRTCHGGVTRPVMLDDLLFEIAVTDSVQAAIAKYRELKEEFYGHRAYDFGPRTLFLAGEHLAGDRRFPAAIAIFEFILEGEPGSAEAWFSIGAVHVMAGDTTAAVTAYERVIELAGQRGWGPVARRRLRDLGRN